MSDIQMALPPHKCSLTLTHNQHRDYYETVDQLVASQPDYYREDNFLPGERERCIASDTIWTLHWYPETPVGFQLLHASTIEALDAHFRKAR